MRWFKQFLLIRCSIACRQASFLASLSLDSPLHWHQRMALQWHLLLCQHCRNYFSQIKAMDAAMTKHETMLPGLSDEAKKRIAEAIQIK